MVTSKLSLTEKEIYMKKDFYERNNVRTPKSDLNEIKSMVFNTT